MRNKCVYRLSAVALSFSYCHYIFSYRIVTFDSVCKIAYNWRFKAVNWEERKCLIRPLSTFLRHTQLSFFRVLQRGLQIIWLEYNIVATIRGKLLLHVVTMNGESSQSYIRTASYYKNKEDLIWRLSLAYRMEWYEAFVRSQRCI